MCGLCGLLGGESSWTAPVRSTLPARQERLERVRQVNRILRYYGLNLRDFQGSAYVLANRTGRSEMVGDLGEIWPLAEKMAGRPLDPFDPELLQMLQAT
ncbi:MAG TPA: hypothetical protein VGD78_16655 [Chthoniobacterales bacterium]